MQFLSESLTKKPLGTFLCPWNSKSLVIKVNVSPAGWSVTKKDISVKVKRRYNFRFNMTNNIIFLSYKRGVTFTLLVSWSGYYKWTIPVAQRYETWVCDSSFAGTADSNPAVCMYVSCDRCVFSGRFHHSTRGVIPNVVCRIGVMANRYKGCSWHGIGSKRYKKITLNYLGSSELTEHFGYNLTILIIKELNYNWSER